MAEYKSEVKKIMASQEQAYERFSNLENLQKLRDTLAQDAQTREMILEKSEGKLSAEQVDKALEKLKELEIDADSLSGQTMMGRLTLRIVDRESPKTIKMALEGAPMEANLWIQLLPEGDSRCAMRLTMRAELNFLMKQMVGSKLKKGVDQLADMLAQIPFVS